LFHPAAQFWYARCLEWGLGVTAESASAFMWYERAAQLGDAQAQCRLGDAARNGELGAPDAEAAFNWYQQAAMQGYPPAMEYVAGCYFYGRGVRLDMEEAARWYQKAAESGGELTPQQLVALKHVLRAAASDAIMPAQGKTPRPAHKR
jgi:TPR repeat protein